MTETLHGLVTGVHAVPLGDSLAVAANIGDAVLTVYDVADFNEDGGTLLVDDEQVDYYLANDDANQLGLLTTLTSAHAVDASVQVWDAANAQAAVAYKAVIGNIDGEPLARPVEAVVGQGHAHALAQTMRVTGAGESVSLVRDGSELRVSEVHGRAFALAALQYLQGGMTTRQSDTDAGVDILGADTGAPGVYLYGVGGDALARLTQEGIATDEPGQPRIVLSNTATPPFDQGGLIAFYVEDSSWIPGSLAAQWIAGPPQVGYMNLTGPSAPSGVAAALGLSYRGAGGGSSASLDADVIGIGASANTLIVYAATNQFHNEIHCLSGGIWMDDLAVGGSLTGASIGAGGRIQRTVSSRRYKSNIKPLPLDEARKVLDLEPVTFTLKEEAKVKNRRTYPGFIAEQAAEVGADLWVDRDGDGQPDGFRYAELTAALIPIIRDQQQQIADLTTRLERSEQRHAAEKE